MKMKNIDTEYILYIILISGASFLFFHSYEFDRKAMFLREGAIPPGYWPRLILIGIFFLTALLLIIKIYKDKVLKEKPIKLKTEKQSVATSRLVFLILLCFLYANIINYIGFLIGTILFAALALFSMGVRKPVTLFFYPLGITGVVYLIFTKVLYMSLPRGVGIFYNLSQLFY